MHSLEAIEIYAQQHPRWFETMRRYAPTSEYRDELTRALPHHWSVQRGEVWYYVSPPDRVLPAQGWKLHVSVSTRDSVSALARALPVLCNEAASFKLLLDPQVTARVNGKLWPRAASGKFITIYPTSPAHFHRIGGALCQALRGLEGPYILSDRRWPGSTCVYYRYGGFAARTELRADGTRASLITTPSGESVPDRRTPYWDPPEWVDDPFPIDVGEAASSAAFGEASERFVVTAALAFSNRGGVYKAIDNHTGREVVLKEARPWVEIGSRGCEATAVLAKEYRLLQRLAGTGSFVRPVASFRAWEHAFLVEEFVAGEHLGQFSIRTNPLYGDRASVSAMPAYLERMRGLWLQIAQAIAAAHAHDVVLGDLSFTNVLIGEGERVVICDLEAATHEGVDLELGLATPGMSASGVSARANDYYALGMLMFGSLMLAHGMSALHPPSRRRFLDELTVDLGLPGVLIELIDDLTERPEQFEASPERAVASIEGLELSPREHATIQPARFALPLDQRFDAGRLAELRRQVEAAVDAVANYLEGTADRSRRDRLFPADLAVFETNPLSLAYGATGVLHALHPIRGQVPRRLLDWVLNQPITNAHYPPGLYLGQAGIAWVLAELGEHERALAVLRQASGHELLLRSPGVMHGAAGYGLACLELWRRFSADDSLNQATRVGAHLLATCVRDEQGARWPDERGAVEIGYAHGGSGIALFLLYLSLATGDSAALQLGREALEFELARAVWLDGSFAGFPARIGAPDDPPSGAPVVSCYWDTGSAGVGTAVARYLAVTTDESERAPLRRWMLRLAGDARRKYVAFPQLFRGLAGLGNYLLDVWAQTGDDQHLLWAWEAAQGVLLFRIERDEGLAFPGEQARRESADLATGAAGVGLFLHRLLGAAHGGRPNFNFVVDGLIDDIRRPPRPLTGRLESA